MAEPTIPNVDKKITLYTSDVPDANTQTINEFDDAAEALANYLIAAPPEYNELAGQLNGFRIGVVGWLEYEKGRVGSLRTDAATAASAAHVAAQQSESAQATAMVAAHFKGKWEDLSGPASVPTTVFYEGRYWVLLQDLGNIAGHPPSTDSPYWGSVQTLTVLRQPVPLSPSNGATGQVTAPTLQATPYANIYDTDTRIRREFELDVQTGDWSDPVYTFSGDVDEHTVSTPLDTLTSYKWRCRDVALSGEVSDWSAVWVFSTADVYINAPTVTDPVALSDDVGETPTLHASAFSVANGGTDTHLNTDWALIDNTTLGTVWESLEDSTNKTSISIPAGILQEGTEYRVRVRYRGALYGTSAWAQSLFTTRDEFITVTNVALLSPESGTDPWNYLFVKGSQFAVSGSKARHTGTRLQVYEGTVLVADVEKTGLFDPGSFSGSYQLESLSGDSPAVSASDATGTAWHVFDGSEDTYWQPSGPSGWVGYTYSSWSRNPYLKGYRISIRDNISAPSMAPRDFKLQGSLDGNFWFDLDERTGVTWAAGGSEYFNLSEVSGTAYPHYRLFVSANNGHPNLEIARLRLYTHTAGNPLETVRPEPLLSATVNNMDYTVRIGYRGENEDVYVWSDANTVRTGTERTLSPFVDYEGSRYTIDGVRYMRGPAFNSDGVLSLRAETDLEYILLGAGGRGGADYIDIDLRAGGGAGGLREGKITLEGGDYPILVGLPGSGNGGDTLAFGLTAIGGGKGGYCHSSNSSAHFGEDGGCGGGSGHNWHSDTYVFGGSGSQGGRGGTGEYWPPEELFGKTREAGGAAGGGGGAGGVGGHAHRIKDGENSYLIYYNYYGGRAGPGVERKFLSTGTILLGRGGTAGNPEPGEVGGGTPGGGESWHNNETPAEAGRVYVRVELDT